jgi:hypothetical protein
MFLERKDVLWNILVAEKYSGKGKKMNCYWSIQVNPGFLLAVTQAPRAQR